MLFAGLDLARRLESAEGHACRQFAESRARLFPESGATSIECAGAYVVFDGIDSPVTQVFGLGVFEEIKEANMEAIERFFFERGAPVNLEVSPLAGVAAIAMICARGYTPIEISSVMYRDLEEPSAQKQSNIAVRVIEPEEAALWSEVNAKGWTHEHPELLDFLRSNGAIAAAREDSPCFLAEIDGQASAAGGLSIHDGVALFAGASTIPEMRRRGLQAALLEARMRYAFDHGCDLAMMVAEAGSESQRNAERKGFRVAYTRMKWSLKPLQ